MNLGVSHVGPGDVKFLQSASTFDVTRGRFSVVLPTDPHVSIFHNYLRKVLILSLFDPIFDVASNLDPLCLHVAITRTPATVAPVRFVVESNQNATEAFRVLVDFIPGVYICFVLRSLQCTLGLASHRRTRWS